MDAELVDDVEDWLCAASSALIVSGDICEPPLLAELVLVLWLVEVAALAEKSNGLLVPGVTPVDGVDDDFDSSAWRASMADDAAPMANNIAKLRQCRVTRPLTHAGFSASVVPWREIQ